MTSHFSLTLQDIGQSGLMAGSASDAGRKKVNGCLIPLPNGCNWQAAKAKYELEIENLIAGRQSRSNSNDPDGLRVGELCNTFLEVVAEFKSDRSVADLQPTPSRR
jgi:hypothetical protein